MIKATYFAANGWLIDFDGIRILIDPWLRGNLKFSPGEWLLKGTLSKEFEIPSDLDLILITQALEDHCHKETLNLLDKKTPVLASKKAAEIVTKLGFQNVISLGHQKTRHFKGLAITATKGAPVPYFENGYIIKNSLDSIYIEPHGFLDEDLHKQNINIVITPIFDIGIKGIGLFIKGNSSMKNIIEKFNPKFVLASTTGGDVVFEGLLGRFLSQKGNGKEIKNILPKKCNLIVPEIGSEYIFQSK